MNISVIMPVWNESARIVHAVERLRALDVQEVIVVDCHSNDGTASMAATAGARVLQSPRGRAAQMNLGARAATGEVLWFIHADVVVPSCATESIREAFADDGVVAGAFRTQTVQDIGSSWVAWFLPLADFRSRYTRLPYGDQALFVRSRTFEAIGGFPSQRILEDLEIARRLSRTGRIAVIDSAVRVSGRRFVARPIYTTWMMYSFPIFYRMGVSTDRLEQWYGAPR